MKHFFRSAARAVAATALALAATASAQAAAYHVSRLHLDGLGHGDFLTFDSKARRLYVTHTSTVHILNPDSLKQIGLLTGLTSAHGVAVDSDRGHLFVSDGNTNAVLVFDRAGGAPVRRIPTGQKPDYILRDPATGLIVAFDGKSNEASLIDPVAMVVVATIKLPGSPEFAQADGRGTIWVNIADRGEIARLDMHRRTLDGLIPLPGCEDVSPLAYDPAGRLLFAGCGNGKMDVVNATTGKRIAIVPIGSEPDGIAFDPHLKRIVVANRDGHWSLIAQRSRARYITLPALPVDIYAKTIALDPITHSLFSSTADVVPPRHSAGATTFRDGSFRLVFARLAQ